MVGPAARGALFIVSPRFLRYDLVYDRTVDGILYQPTQFVP